MQDINAPEAKVIQHETRLTSMESHVQKLTTIVNKIVNDQAVADYKHTQAATISTRLEEMVENARNQIADQAAHTLKEVNLRDTRLNQAMEELRANTERQHDTRALVVDKEFLLVRKSIEDLDNRMEKCDTLRAAEIKKNAERIDGLQKVIYIATGGASVILFVLELLPKIVHI